MVKELRTAAAALSNVHLRQLMNAFLNDSSLWNYSHERRPQRRCIIIISVDCLSTLSSLSRLFAIWQGTFPRPTRPVDRRAFLHDIGKVKELAVRKSIEYTTEGRLIGHISLGYEMLVEKVNALPSFPAELAMLLKHIVLSHHGEYEFGSPKRPKIQEAIIINYLDDLEAKINNFQSTIRKENVAEGAWTNFSKMHDRYLYRQSKYAGPPENLWTWKNRDKWAAECRRRGIIYVRDAAAGYLEGIMQNAKCKMICYSKGYFAFCTLPFHF